MQWQSILVAGMVVLSGFLPVRQLSEVDANDNRTPAGVLRDSVLTIELAAGSGMWYPERGDAAGRVIHAFGTAVDELSNPGPLIRVPAGTIVRARIRNGLDAPLTIHGLFDRSRTRTVIVVQPGATDSVEFRLTEPGTYHYWGSTRGAEQLTDRFGAESQLVGAIVVDAPGDPTDDHVFVIGLEDDSAETVSQRRVHAAVVNGRSWPHSRISTVDIGDTIRMRWINVSDRFHPMHLHGSHFKVRARGDIGQDTVYGPAGERLVATELLAPGETMSVSWVPARTGNWLMHCHIAEHTSAALRGRPRDSADGSRARADDAMAGIVTGWRVVALPDTIASMAESPLRPRDITLLAQDAPGRFGDMPALGFVVQDGENIPGRDSVVVPGPPLVLVRDLPVRITVVNNLTEPTSVHWHGIELDSYYDGVPRWSGDDDRIAPLIEPGDSFEVSFTPRRAGTFIYHSHTNEEHQIASGLYGPLIVLEAGRRFDPETDRVWVLSQNGPSGEVDVMLNGETEPVLEMRANQRYRIRLININPNVPLTLSVLGDSMPVVWRMIAKDGIDVPADQLRTHAAVQRAGVGETYDFELTPDRPGELSVRAHDPFGELLLSATIRVQPADEES